MPASKHAAHSAQIAKSLKTFRRKITAESWICSILCGLSVGSAIATVCSLVLWALGVKTPWASISALVVAAGVSTPLFYFGKFRCSARTVASRVDALGLEERILTMTQLAEDNSFMAQRQREDAREALKTIDSSLLKVAVRAPLIVVCAVTLAVSASAMTASTVSDKSLMDLINAANEPEKVYHSAKYGVKDEIGGKVYGRLVQTVEHGAATDAVQAVADENYIFVGWSDGCEDALRLDKVVAKDIKVYAVFVPIEEYDEGDEEMPNDDGGDGNDADQGLPQDAPPIPKPQDDDADNDGAGGGTTNPNNQVIDGGTFIGDVYGNSLSEAQDAMGNSAGLSSGQTNMIGDYFGNIAK